MKTKTLLFVCLFLGIGLTQLSAQNGKNGNGSTSEFFVWDGAYIDIPKECGSQEYDRCYGTVNLHVVYFYVNGVSVAENCWYRGEVTNPRTKEVFELKDIYKSVYLDEGGYGHWNLKGNLGNHYIIFYFYDWESGSYTIEKAICNFKEK